MAENGIPVNLMDRPIYHVHEMGEPKRGAKRGAERDAIERMFIGFNIVAVFSVVNEFLSKSFEARKATLLDPNMKTMFHLTKTTKPGTLERILDGGLQVRYALRGLFGRGIYLAETVYKSNAYASKKGDPTEVRTVFVCEVLCGNQKQYELGLSDPNLVEAPAGFDSVSGFFHRSKETCVFNDNQVRITHVVLYTNPNAANETKPDYTLPPTIDPLRVVYITPALSEFCGKMHTLAEQKGVTQAVTRLNTLMMKKFITVDQYLEDVAKLLGRAPPPGLADKLRKECDRCIRWSQLAPALPVASALPVAPALPVTPALVAPLFVTPALPAALDPPAAFALPMTPLPRSLASESPMDDDEDDGEKGKKRSRKK
jgi:hypothetical protein